MKNARTHFPIAVAVIAAGALAGCGSDEGVRSTRTGIGPRTPALRYQEATDRCCAGSVYLTRATAYYPASNRLEGGHKDRLGKKLRTLQDFVDGRVSSVSVAMDATVLPYGAKVCIPELNSIYGKSIDFRVVDTGGAFRGRGLSRIDVCVRTKKDAYHAGLNRQLELVVCDR